MGRSSRFPSRRSTSTSSYSSETARATRSQVNRSLARRTAWRPKTDMSLGWRYRWASRSATASGSRGGTRYPVSLSRTVNLIPPTFEPTTGVPQAIASTGVIPNGSYHGVDTKTSAAL